MFDIIKYCEDQGIPHLLSGHHHCHDGWVQIHCPFCGSGNDGWHLGVSLTTSVGHCWRCGSHPIYHIIAQHLRTSAPDAVHTVLKRYESFHLLREVEEKTNRELKPPENMKDLSPRYRKYLKSRAFDPDQLIEVWDLKGTSHLSQEWNWRVVYPVCIQNGTVHAHQGRTIAQKVKPKYKTSSNEASLTDPRHLLYGLHRCSQDKIVICEGAMDVWRLGPGAVATFGIDWNERQALQIKNFTKKYIFFDPEPQAQKQAQKLAEYLSLFPGTTEIIDNDIDPGDMDQDDADSLMRELDF